MLLFPVKPGTVFIEVREDQKSEIWFQIPGSLRDIFAEIMRSQICPRRCCPELVFGSINTVKLDILASGEFGFLEIFERNQAILIEEFGAYQIGVEGICRERVIWGVPIATMSKRQGLPVFVIIESEVFAKVISRRTEIPDPIVARE